MRRVALAVALMVGLAAVAPRAQEERATAGKAVYERWCAGCHGAEGRGDGPAAGTMLPRPRDFTTGLYQIRSTPSGAQPTDEDLMAIVDHGMPGTAMPGWRDNLSAGERRDVIAYLKSFSPAFQRDPAEPVDLGDEPGASEEGLVEGREIFEKIECFKCHGLAGRGDGTSAPTLEDDSDHPIRAADLTENWHFNGGGETEDIMRRLMTGLNGTPMPANVDLVDANVVTREQLWHLAQYIRSLSPKKAPVVREVVRAARVEGDLPSGPDDPAWDSAERYYIPLVGQIVVRPRWFAPTVDGVWVQALHDGDEIAMRFIWHDPSRSPDPRWEEWTTKIQATMAGELPEPGAPPDNAAGAPPDTAAVEAAPAAGSGQGPDALTIQFPTTPPAGMERPYFLMGNERGPVYLWSWRGDRDGVEEQVARAYPSGEPLGAPEGGPAAADTFDQGEYRLFVRRALDAGGVENRLPFETGKAIPIALFAWDGSNGEAGTRGSISTWYFLYLDRPGSPLTIAAPILATLLTAALGAVVVMRTRRRARSPRAGGG